MSHVLVKRLYMIACGNRACGSTFTIDRPLPGLDVYCPHCGWREGVTDPTREER